MELSLARFTHCLYYTVAIAWLAVTQSFAAPILPITQDYVVRVWEDQEGPGHISVTAFAQTPDGYLWLGTFQNLVRFDGARFQPWDPPGNPLSDQGVLSLCTDAQGALWVGSTRGIGRHQGSSWQTFTSSGAGYPGGFVRSIRTDGAGRLFATAGNRLTEFEGGRFVALPRPVDAETNREMHCVVQTNGTIWGFTPSFLGRFEQGAWTTVLSSNDLRSINAHVQGITLSRDGGLWVAHGAMVRKYKDGAWVQTLPRPEGFMGDVLTLMEDSQGNLWAGGYTRGVLVFKADGPILKCTLDEGLANNATLALFEDSENNIWIGSNGGGVARLKPRTFRVFERQAGLPQPVINTVLWASEGKLLAGTHGSGLLPFDGERFGKPIISADQKLGPNSWVQALAEDKAGSVWIGTYSDGLFQMRGPEIRQVPKQELGHGDVIALHVDSRDRLWIGTPAGLVKHEKKTFTRMGSSTGAPKAPVIAIQEDADGRIWIASQGKVYHGNGDKFTQFQPPGEDPGNVVSLFRDGSGALWMGTFSGKIARLVGDRWQVWTWKDGLPIWNTLAFQEDQEGHLWLATVEGMCRVARLSLDAVQAKTQNRLDTLRFDKSDGLLTVAARALFQPIAARDAGGRLWFATIKGLAMADPAKVRLTSRGPPTYIDKLEVDGKGVTIAAGTETIIPPGAKRIKIRFTGVNLGAPESVHFRYLLAPLDTEWIDGGKERTVEFADLRPGQYTFRVQASNREGVRPAEGATLSFALQPFFWQAGWFHLALRLALAAITAGGVWRYLTARHRRERKQLEQAKALAEERAQKAEAVQAREIADKANQEKSLLLAAMSHEIRSPMNRVIDSSRWLLRSELQTPQRKVALKVEQSAETLCCILDTVVDVWKAESDQLHLNNLSFNFSETISGAVAMIKETAAENRIGLNIKHEPGLPERVYGDPWRLRQVLVILLVNTIELLRQGTISIDVQKGSEPNQLCLTVDPHGESLLPREERHLFAKSGTAYAGLSRELIEIRFGLEMVKKLVELMGGQLCIQSNSSGFSMVRISLLLPPAAEGQSDPQLGPNEKSDFATATP